MNKRKLKPDTQRYFDWLYWGSELWSDCLAGKGEPPVRQRVPVVQRNRRSGDK
ncbi:hypothetical protein N9924_01325 [bacterium]|nr:hypothetical protein [bacterium]